MRARHLWLVDNGRPWELRDFLRGCLTSYPASDHGWSPLAFIRSATISFDRLVIADVGTLKQLAQFPELLDKYAETLATARNRLAVIAPSPPVCDPAILDAAGFTIVENANAVRTLGGLHAAA